jgi:DNA recombination-dependent growth factor C
MLCDILFNESIKELGGVFVSKIVVKLSFMWLDNISFVRTCAIGK